jgi:hypothetical protein
MPHHLLAQLELQVPRGVLLTASNESDSSTNKSKVAYESSTAIFHEDSTVPDLSVFSCYGHSEMDVVQRARLGNLPVNSHWPGLDSSSLYMIGHLGHVDNKVTDLTIKIILVCPPACLVSVIECYSCPNWLVTNQLMPELSGLLLSS